MTFRTRPSLRPGTRASRTRPTIPAGIRAGPCLGILAAVVLSGCARSVFTPVEPDPLPAESAEAAPVGLLVEGVVTDRWGYVVPDAWVTVRVGSPNQGDVTEADCAGASHLPTRTRTSPLGEFAVVVEAGRRDPFRACLEVEALPPAGRRLRDNAVVIPSAFFARLSDSGEPTQRAAVRVILY